MFSKEVAAGVAAALALLLGVYGLGGFDASSSSSISIRSANNKVVEAPKAAIAAASRVHGHLGAQVDSPASTDRSSDRANPDGPRVAGPVPLASPFQRGCLTRSNTVNFSYRNGTRPSIIPLHLTVSANVFGWDDANGVFAFLNRSSTSASANYIIDNEGHCIYAVAEVYKAWTQAWFNSASACSFEVINTGSEATYAGTAGLRKLALVVHDCAKRWNIPLRVAKISGSTVVRSGVIDHLHLGPAGGGHVDISKFGAGCRNVGDGSHTLACVRLVLRMARRVDGKPIAAIQRRRCSELNTLRRHTLYYHHKHGKPGGRHLTPHERHRVKVLKGRLARNRIVCKVGPPGKRGTIRRR